MINTLQLLIGLRSLPAYKQYMQLGHSSLSSLGIVGALIDCVLILLVAHFGNLASLGYEVMLHNTKIRIFYGTFFVVIVVVIYIYITLRSCSGHYFTRLNNL